MLFDWPLLTFNHHRRLRPRHSIGAAGKRVATVRPDDFNEPNVTEVASRCFIAGTGLTDRVSSLDACHCLGSVHDC